MIPKPLYEILPAIYVVVGIAAMVTVESATSFISGLAIGIAGLLVLSMRRNHRLNKNKRKSHKIQHGFLHF